MGTQVTATEAARSLNVSTARIRQLIDKGRLPATKLGSYWVLDSDDVEWARDRQKQGRPKKIKAAPPPSS